MNEPNTWWYFKECLLEEIAARGVLLGIVLPWLHLGGWVGVGISAAVYALAHFILYSWQMAAVCIPFGLFLGGVYLWAVSNFSSSSALIGVLICWGLHFVIAALAYKFTSFKDLERKWRR